MQWLQFIDTHLLYKVKNEINKEIIKQELAIKQIKQGREIMVVIKIAASLDFFGSEAGGTGI